MGIPNTNQTESRSNSISVSVSEVEITEQASDVNSLHPVNVLNSSEIMATVNCTPRLNRGKLIAIVLILAAISLFITIGIGVLPASLLLLPILITALAIGIFVFSGLEFSDHDLDYGDLDSTIFSVFENSFPPRYGDVVTDNTHSDPPPEYDDSWLQDENNQIPRDDSPPSYDAPDYTNTYMDARRGENNQTGQNQSLADDGLLPSYEEAIRMSSIQTSRLNFSVLSSIDATEEENSETSELGVIEERSTRL